MALTVAVFSARKYDVEHFNKVNQQFGFNLEFFDTRLEKRSAKLAQDCEVVCAFVNDELNQEVLQQLAAGGCKIIAMRCAGYNNVDLTAAAKLGLQVVRVPAYSPQAVAEHAMALLLTLVRKTHKAYQRTRDANFALDGLVGFNLYGRTAGVIGTGKIGLAMLQILKGFGCRLLAADPYPSAQAIELGVEYVSVDELLRSADIISLHCPLTEQNHHLIDEAAFAKMKDGVVVINTSRGGLLDASAAIAALKSGRLGGLGLDVYEKERELFFEDKSAEVILDDVFRRLSACHNVIFTGHQAFLTAEALDSIATTTLNNIATLQQTGSCDNLVQA